MKTMIFKKNFAGMLPVLLLILMLAFSLTACGTNCGDNMSGGCKKTCKKSMSSEEAIAEYEDLFAQENAILSENKELWEKVFKEADKGMTLQEDGKNYGDFLLDTIESAKDQFTEDELKLLMKEAEKIKDIEDKLTKLEEKYPEVAQKAMDSDMEKHEEGDM